MKLNIKNIKQIQMERKSKTGLTIKHSQAHNGKCIVVSVEETHNNPDYDNLIATLKNLHS